MLIIKKIVEYRVHFSKNEEKKNEIETAKTTNIVD